MTGKGYRTEAKRTALLACLLAAGLAACRTQTTAAGSPMSHHPLTKGDRLSEFVGKEVSLAGQVSEQPWQHLIAEHPGHPVALYFDNDLTGQTVIYCREDIATRDPIRVYGRLALTEGTSKRPGSKEIVGSYQLVVDRWEPEAP